MKNLFLFFLLTTAFSATATTLECDNFGVNYKVTLDKDSIITNLEGLVKYNCVETDFNISGYTTSGSDGTTCTSDSGKKKEFITIYGDDSIRLVPRSKIGYSTGFVCK